MSTSNTTSETANTALKDRRYYKRFNIRRTVLLKVKDPETKKTRYITFHTKNISSNGMALEWTDYPFPKGTVMNMFVLFTIGENVTRMLCVDAYFRYKSKEHQQVGIMFYKRVI